MFEWVKQVLGLDGQRYGKYYVYELRDPRFKPARTFYVGKGTQNRLYQHEKDMRRLLTRGRAGAMRLQPRHKRILEIIDDGWEVEYYVVYRTNDEEEAYQVEAKRIDFYGLEKLSNKTYGHRKRARRAAAVKTLS